MCAPTLKQAAGVDQEPIPSTIPVHLYLVCRASLATTRLHFSVHYAVPLALFVYCVESLLLSNKRGVFKVDSI